MKILIVPLRFYPESGASPSRWLSLARRLVELGYDVDILTSMPNYPYGRIFDGYGGKLFSCERSNGLCIYRYWCYPTVARSVVKRALNMLTSALFIWLFAFRVRRILSYDRVFIQTPALPNAVSAMMLFKGVFRRKCVLNVSDIWPSTGVQMGALREGSMAYRYFAWCERYLVRNADMIVGQSEEILSRIRELPNSGKLFLYRNLPMRKPCDSPKTRNRVLKICFAGMLGVAQDVLSIVKSINFRELGVEFHIVGIGGQYEEIRNFVGAHADRGITVHGLVEKSEMPELYKQFDVALVPLVTHIRGAFPSKIFDVLPAGMPVLFSGRGEAAELILNNNLGYVSDPLDFDALKSNIKLLQGLSDEDYAALSKNCLDYSRQHLSFDNQMNRLTHFLDE